MLPTIKGGRIVLGHNGKDFLAECLASVPDQSYPTVQYEVICAHNASTDGSPDLVPEESPELRAVRLERNWGFRK